MGDASCVGSTPTVSRTFRFWHAIEQVLGIHLGIRHLVNGSYTVEAFMDAAVAVHREDQAWASPTELYMAQSCLKALKAIYMWE